MKKIQKPSALDQDLAAAYAALGLRGTDTLAEPGSAKKMLIELLTHHADILLHMGRENEASNLFALAAELVGGAPENLLTADGEASVEDRARAMLSAGHFVMASKLYEQIIKTAPDSARAHKNLSALYHRMGQTDRARALLTDYFAHYPLDIDHQGTADLPTVLCMYGYDKTEVKLGKKTQGGFHHYRSGGHFMLKHLMKRTAYNMFRYTIAADNINQGGVLMDCAVMINTIADADTEYQSLQSLNKYLIAHPGINIINHPTKVLETTRDNNCERFSALPGFRFPRTQRFEMDDQSPLKLAIDIKKEGFDYPLIIRETGTHTAVTTALVHNNAALQTYLGGVQRGSVYVIEFIENASDAGHYSKIRFFSIAGILYPVVYHTDTVWNVHGDNRKTFMANHAWMMKREEDFLENPAAIIGADIYKRLQQLPAMIGLDFFGFDFTLLDNGDILIFELNPAMRHSFKHAQNFPYMQPHMQAISDAFDAMVQKRIRSTIKA